MKIKTNCWLYSELKWHMNTLGKVCVSKLKDSLLNRYVSFLLPDLVICYRTFEVQHQKALRTTSVRPAQTSCILQNPGTSECGFLCKYDLHTQINKWSWISWARFTAADILLRKLIIPNLICLLNPDFCVRQLKINCVLAFGFIISKLLQLSMK